MNNFLFLGGDTRSLYAAKRLSESYDCFLYGWRAAAGDIAMLPSNVPLLRGLSKCDNLVLPLPTSRDGVNINAPNFNEKLPLSIIPEAVNAGGTVYCGMANVELQNICYKSNLTLVDYFEREELIVMNALVTAEGALEIILRERLAAIFGAEILITGYGRISKALTGILVAMGAKVTVAARKYADLSWAQINRCNTVHFREIDGIIGNFDVIVNTVPAGIFDKERMKKIKKNCLFVELASELSISESAASESINVINAQSLPGKTAPITAGNIIADTIINIINESSQSGDIKNKGEKNND